MSSAGGVYQIKSRAENTTTQKMLNSHPITMKYQHIAPTPNDSTIPQKFTSRMVNAPYAADQTQSVARRNARERNRVKQVNNSFAKLRQHIPQYVINDLTKGGGRGPQKKVSKVDTLRIAVEYIRRLQTLVEDLNENNTSNNVSENSSYVNNSTESSTTTCGKQYYNNEAINALPNFEETQLQIQQTTALMSSFSPTPENTGCQSPTSSFNSSMSFDSGHFEATQQLSPTPATSISPLNSTQLQLKFETYNNFNLHEEDCSPDDDEILDYISLWQEQ